MLTFALLDSRSERSFCVRDLARKVGARGPRCRLPIKTLSSGVSVDEVDGELIPITVSRMSNDRSLELRAVVTVKDIPAEGYSLPLFDILSNLEHLRGIRFEDLPNKRWNCSSEWRLRLFLDRLIADSVSLDFLEL